MKKSIAVIGAGPAGIMAAGTAASRGYDVTLFEKNEKIGKKLFITGKGRCNITNAAPIEDFFDSIMSNRDFMYSSFYSFTNEDMLALLGQYNLTTKVERGNRVFPRSNKSSDVIKALGRYLKDMKVRIKLNTEILNIKRDEDLFYLDTVEGRYAYEKIIIATGGLSYPKTGSTGDGHGFAKKLGHTISDIYPSLVPIEIREEAFKELQGLSLRNVEIRAYAQNIKGRKEIYKDFGEIVFTHYGISGPIVLSMSTYLYDYLDRDIKIAIDLKPALDHKTLDKRILRDFEKYNNKDVKNSLDDLLPAKLREFILNLSDVDLGKKVHQISREERERILGNLKSLEMSFENFRPVSEAIVTSGGVSVDEIDPSTMESKLVKGLFFAGELVDVDGLTGGYNLQIAYSTGHLAGMSV